MKNFVNMGEKIVITATAAILSGGGVVTNQLFGVAENDIANAAQGVLSIEGVFRLPKNTAVAINEGDLVDWDNSVPHVSKAITPAASDIQDFGIAMETVATAGARINVKLRPGSGVFT